MEMKHKERQGNEMEWVEIKLRIDSAKDDEHVMCVPDFHGSFRVCFHWRVDRTEKQDSWRIDSSYQF